MVMLPPPFSSVQAELGKTPKRLDNYTDEYCLSLPDPPW